MAIIIGIASGQFTIPIIGKAHAFQLRLHCGNIIFGPGRRVYPAFEGGIFRRQTESIPAHWMKHIKAVGFFIARNNIAKGVIADMPHMNPT